MTSLTSDQKLDHLLTAMASVQKTVDNIEALMVRVAALETKNKALEDRNLVLESSVKSLTLEVKQLKDHVNSREQESRVTAIRLFNFPGSNEEINLAGRIYDKILKPILQAAKSKGDISSIPQVGNTISDVFRVGRFAQGANKPPPPILIKLATPALRLAILRNKRNNTPPPSEEERSLGVKRFLIAEDLTSPTYRKLKELLQDDRVLKAWTINGTIWVVPKGDNASPLRVKSAYDHNDLILK
jgi:hypothetical protein